MIDTQSLISKLHLLLDKLGEDTVYTTYNDEGLPEVTAKYYHIVAGWIREINESSYSPNYRTLPKRWVHMIMKESNQLWNQIHNQNTHRR